MSGVDGQVLTSMPFRLRRPFLTPAERGLYFVLKEMAQSRYVILTKVSLNEIFTIVRPNENVHYFGRLFRKNIDFLLCSPQSLEPQIAVDILRGAGGRNSIRAADRFLEELFLAVGLPLVQVRLADRPGVADMVNLFQEAILRAKMGEKAGGSVGTDSVPSCPVCGKMMVLRAERRGKTIETLFYGCVDSPTCRGRLNIQAD